MKKPVPSEDSVHRAVLAHLRMRAPKSAVIWHTPNGGSRNVIEAAKLKAMGVMAGFPDVMIWHAGNLYGLELKRERGGRVSSKQAECMAALTREGARCAVAHGVDHAIEILEGWDLISSQKSKTRAGGGEPARV